MRTVNVALIYVALTSDLVSSIWIASRLARLKKADADSQALNARMGNAFAIANRNSAQARREFGVASLSSALGFSLLILSPGSVFSLRDSGHWLHLASGILLLVGSASWCAWCLRVV